MGRALTAKAIEAAQERDWQERNDARTLADANEITSDKKRYQNAVKKAKVIAGEDAIRVRSMNAVANKKVSIKRTTTKKKK